MMPTPGVGQDAPSAPDLVVELLRAMIHQGRPRLLFIRDDLRHDGVLKVRQHFLLTLSERGLIGGRLFPEQSRWDHKRSDTCDQHRLNEGPSSGFGYVYRGIHFSPVS